MKTFLVDLTGIYKPGDMIIVSHIAPTGGRNSAKCIATEQCSGHEMAVAVAAIISGGASEFNAGHYAAAADQSTVSVMCSDDAGDVTIEAELEGGSPSGGRKFDVIAL